jgi:integrase
MKTNDIMIWGVRLKKRKTPTYEIRWKTADKPHSTTRRTKALADSFRSDLLQAAKRGEEFDIDSGLPDSMVKAQPEAETDPEPIRSVLTVAQAYVEMRWPRAAPKSRDGITDALATVIPALTTDQPKRPDKKELRTALRKYALLPSERRPEPTGEIAQTIQWLESAVIPVEDLNQAKVLRPALDALTVNLDGTAAGANTISRKRAVFFNFLEYTVELGDLAANPLTTMKWTPPKTSQTVDPRVVVNQVQAHNLLVAVTYIGQRGRGRHLSAMFACMYYAAMRPAEAINVKKNDCHLPDTGWGTVTLAKSRPEVNTRWSDTGQTHEERQLKHRAVEDVRPIPIPPVLVQILRAHLEEYGTAPDGRLFQTERGGPIGSTAYTEVWQQARPLALTPDQVDSPMAGRPYDLRHAAVSLWLNGGISPTEIAKRAGHSVEVLLRVYAKCVYGQEEITNKRIEEILDAGRPDEPTETAGEARPPGAPSAGKARSGDDPESTARRLRSSRAGRPGSQRER